MHNSSLINYLHRQIYPSRLNPHVFVVVSITALYIVLTFRLVLTWIIFLILTLWTSHDDILTSPRKYLNVRAMIGERHGAAVKSFFSFGNVIYAVKVLFKETYTMWSLCAMNQQYFIGALTWYSRGSSVSWRIKLQRATELLSTVHSVCKGSRFTFEQNGWIERPLKVGVLKFMSVGQTCRSWFNIKVMKLSMHWKSQQRSHMNYNNECAHTHTVFHF